MLGAQVAPLDLESLVVGDITQQCAEKQRDGASEQGRVQRPWCAAVDGMGGDGHSGSLSFGDPGSVLSAHALTCRGRADCA
ncbi:hypothetical protein [Pseudomonas syringae]|uniref:hypothetical protein n=1 Tax=Pseudomonas syringae TaxID=317 RepID=UPI0018A16D9A|nr:hypothetical protein [Pseudomonas syringae]